MELHTYEIKLPKSYRQEWHLYPIGDIHYTNIGCDKTALVRDIKEIADNPLAFWIGMGDYDEYITYGDPRFDPESFTKDARVDFLKSMGQKQTQKMVNIFEPIKDRCIGITEGNHELEYAKRHDHDPAAAVAENLGVKFLTYEALTRISVSGPDGRKRYSITVYTHHGWGGGDTAGAGLTRMERLAITWDADIYITGHDHKLASTVRPRLGINSHGNFTDRPVALIQSGTYLKSKQVGIQGYEVKKGYKPSPIGCPRITIKGNHLSNFSIGLTLKHHTTI